MNINFDVTKDAWFSPTHIIDKFEQLRRIYKDNIFKHDFKKAREMFVAAVTLLGAFELDSRNIYFMQINSQSSSPDVMGASQTELETGILLELVQLEITELEEHYKSNDIVEFLNEVKLKKGYNEHTMIVCFVNKIVPANNREIFVKLSKTKPKSPITIIGKPITGEMGNYMIMNVWPQLSKQIIFNVNETAQKYNLPARVRFHKGTNKVIKYNNEIQESLNIFDILGLDQTKIFNKFGSIGIK